MLILIKSEAQMLIVKDSANNVIGSFNPGSKIKKQILTTVQKVSLQYSDSSLAEFDFYLTTGITTPYVVPGNHGSVNFDFKKAIGGIILKHEATMVFYVHRLQKKKGTAFISKAYAFHVIE